MLAALSSRSTWAGHSGSTRLAASVLATTCAAATDAQTQQWGQQPGRGWASTAAEGDTISVEVNPFRGHQLEPPPISVTTSRAELLQHFRDMYRLRRMEISADMLYKAKEIRGFCHLYDGQEAVVVGMEASLDRSDSIITSYRDHPHHVMRGGTVLEVFAELMGRQAGASKGKGGSMHMYRRKTNFFGGQGIVGAQVPLGAGLALAHHYRGDGGVAVTMYGDGAANQGQVFESFNMAALWELPCIFVCENNHYGMGTAEWRAAKSASFYTRGGDYMPGMKCDGMDVMAVKQAFAFSKRHVLEKGPLILEMDTYRYHGHSMSDPGSTYRTRDEISSIRKKRDPLEHVRQLLLSHELANVTELKAIEKEVKGEIDGAIAAAKDSPYPAEEELWTNIYKAPLGETLRAVDSMHEHILPS